MIAAALLLGSRSAASAPSVSLAYRVPEAAGAARTCPSRDDFIEALRSRGAVLDSAEAAERAQGVDVSIRYADGVFVGELSVRTRAPRAASRVVHDPDCAEVVSGLALTAAIALGGDADGRNDDSAPAQSVTDAPAAIAEPTSGSDASEPGAAAEGSEPPRESFGLRGSSFWQENSIVVDAGTLRLEGARSYTLTAGIYSGLIPSVTLPRYDLNASVATFLSLPDGAGTRLVGTLLQVHWAVLGPVTSQHAEGVSLDAWGLEGGINACSALTYDTRGWVALVCSEFGAGWLVMDAKGRGATSGRAQTAGYGFAGLAFDAQYNLASWAHLGVRVGGRFNTPLRAEDPEGARLFDSSPWGAYGTAGFGLHF